MDVPSSSIRAALFLVNQARAVSPLKSLDTSSALQKQSSKIPSCLKNQNHEFSTASEQTCCHLASQKPQLSYNLEECPKERSQCFDTASRYGPFLVRRPASSLCFESSTHHMEPGGQMTKTEPIPKICEEYLNIRKSKSRSKSGKRRFRWDKQHSKMLEELVRGYDLKNMSEDKQLVCQVFPGFSERFVKRKLKEVTQTLKSKQSWTLEEDTIIFKYLIRGAADWQKVQESYFCSKSLKEVCERVDELRQSQLKKISSMAKQHSPSPTVRNPSQRKPNKVHKKVLFEAPETWSKYKTISTCHTILTSEQPGCRTKLSDPVCLDVVITDFPETNIGPGKSSTTPPRCEYLGSHPQNNVDRLVGESLAVEPQKQVGKEQLSDLPHLVSDNSKSPILALQRANPKPSSDLVQNEALWDDEVNFTKLLGCQHEDSWLGWHI
jgi:hypothetical protein